MFDLNLPWPVAYGEKPSSQEYTNLYNVIATCYTSGYNRLAINFTIGENVKITGNDTSKLNPIPIDSIRQRFSHYEDLQIFTRATFVVSDPSKCQNVAKLNQVFDLVAVQPTTERALQLAVSNLDIDIVSINLLSRLPFFLKHKAVGSGVLRGIKFEITYAGLISGLAGYTVINDSNTNALMARKNFFSNVLQLIRASRNRGLLVTSGALMPVQVRNHSDILILLETLGLPFNKGKESMMKNAEDTLVSGRMRLKSYKQVIVAGAGHKGKETLYAVDSTEKKKRGRDEKASESNKKRREEVKK